MLLALMLCVLEKIATAHVDDDFTRVTAEQLVFLLPLSRLATTRG